MEFHLKSKQQRKQQTVIWQSVEKLSEKENRGYVTK